MREDYPVYFALADPIIPNPIYQNQSSYYPDIPNIVDFISNPSDTIIEPAQLINNQLYMPARNRGIINGDYNILALPAGLGPVSTKESINSRYKTYPNPFTSSLYIESKTLESFVLCDLAGRKLSTFTIEIGKNEIDLSTLAAGVYTIQSKNEVIKILKQ